MNPYESLAGFETRAAAGTGRRQSPASLWRISGRWTLICGISAAPSFFWGCSLHAEALHIAAMICGIATFVAAYTCLESSRLYRRAIQLPYVRRTALIGYGTRLLISLIFPVGLTLDMFTGILSVLLVEGAWGAPAESSFLILFVTTIVQGIFLNLILLSYMLVVYALQCAVGSCNDARHRRRELETVQAAEAVS